MTPQNRKIFIAILIVLTPVVCLTIGKSYAWLGLAPDLNLNELDPVKNMEFGCLVFGIIGSGAALISGPMVERRTKRRSRPQGSLMGYLIPCGLAILLTAGAILQEM